ncbi:MULTISPECIES: aspartate aminotransferase family protein [unclassified Microbacterium]|uniref:pyridoxal phosphate-dependent decarboxylase family protein n=1 Tax=unclassified Microbacterium TaxID=2609290 RepID=UPI0012FBB626|nr:aspartate aminotransferase family protein [Microbacterium sp. MAH-37]MVQ42586.1 aminotransferase class V-fold PLP-dependent enzyme [Microbacterium sp. MAH-37]
MSGILDRLRELRAGDAPTHGGHVLAYVYDSGMPELDELADAAASLARPVNGLDPTVFPSIAAMERDVLGFVRRALHGGRDVVGSVTSGGTESCLLAVKTARDLWRADGGAGRPRLLAPSTAHAAFQKAARMFDLDYDAVPCRPDGTVDPDDLVARMDEDVALVVVSAPAYPSGALDPIRQVAAAAKSRGIRCHADACFGGLVLPWWPDAPVWDFRVPGVTSISADLHKFGYAPKGVSVLMHRGRRQHRAQFFATTRWPGYPVVNPTLLGSKSASPLAAAWAIVQRLGDAGFAELTASIARVARGIRTEVETIRGLTVMGDPVGPAIALIADTSVPAPERVDPHRLADQLAQHGWKIQHQPGFTQADESKLPRSAHLTLTPVLERNLPEFRQALAAASDAVRGRGAADGRLLAGAVRMLGYGPDRVPGPEASWRLLRIAGAGSVTPGQPMSTLMALIEELPASVAEALLTELLARFSEPR